MPIAEEGCPFNQFATVFRQLIRKPRVIQSKVTPVLLLNRAAILTFEGYKKTLAILIVF
jgi:hypothetical protein